ncbi:MAG: NAD-dependent epimerase/dehydratase family protein [Salinivirgaceae bacterium]
MSEQTDNLKTLITGANSFIGTYFKNNSPQFQVSEVDLLTNKPAEIDFSKAKVVFHVAAIVHQDKSIPDTTYFKVNSDLAFEVAKHAKQNGVKQFVFMSTVKVYGENSTESNPWTEDSECHPSDAYGKSKLDAEKRLMELNDNSFTVSIIRTPVVYGAGVKGNIQKIARFVKNRKLIPLKGINNQRAMVYLGNLVALIQEVIKQQKPGIFLAGDGEVLSTSLFVKYLIEATGQRRYFITFPLFFQYLIKLLKPGFYHRLFGCQVIDNSKTLNELNFKPPYSPIEGLKEVMNSL